jgi:predicted DCC family thiol-disulfide oxidoreductase YuxK
MNEHLVLFDATCPFCHRSVSHLIDLDQDRHLLFTPLDGATAEQMLVGIHKSLLKSNSLILIEQFETTGRKFWIRSRAVLRAYWFIGRGWGLIGVFAFVPSCLGDIVYRWVAEHRHQFHLDMPKIKAPEDRFLP